MLFNVPARKFKIVLVYVAPTLFLSDSATLKVPKEERASEDQVGLRKS